MQHEKTGPAIAGFEGEKGLGAQESRQWEKQENRVFPKPSRKKFSLADYLTYWDLFMENSLLMCVV